MRTRHNKLQNENWKRVHAKSWSIFKLCFLLIYCARTKLSLPVKLWIKLDAKFRSMTKLSNAPELTDVAVKAVGGRKTRECCFWLVQTPALFDHYWFMRSFLPRRANEITAFPAGAGFSVAWKNKQSALELWNVFMLPYFLNRESVGVLFTFFQIIIWESDN